jgi:hypothetical protein
MKKANFIAHPGVRKRTKIDIPHSRNDTTYSEFFGKSGKSRLENDTSSSRSAATDSTLSGTDAKPGGKTRICELGTAEGGVREETICEREETNCERVDIRPGGYRYAN